MIDLSPLDVSEPLTRESRSVFSWAAADMTLSARTPQLYSFARDAVQTVSDFGGTSYSVVPHLPAWHFISEIPSLLLADNDLLSYVFGRHPSAMSGMVDLVHRSGINNNGGILSIGNDAASDALLYISIVSGNYRITHDNGTDTPVFSELITAPTNNQSFRLRWEVFTNGSVRLHQSINGAAESSGAQSDAHAFASAWGANDGSDEDGFTRLYLNSVGASNPGEAAYRRVIIVPGSGRSLAQLEAIR